MSPGYPRIRRRLAALGIPLFQWTPRVNTQKDWNRCEAIIDKLAADHQVELLRAIMAGDVSTGELLEAERRGELTGSKILSRAKLGKPLWESIDETLPLMGRTESTRNGYRWSFVALRRQSIVPWPADPMRVRDLMHPKMRWQELAEGWPNSASDWNHVVRALWSFLTTYLGSSQHEFRVAFGKKAPLMPEDRRVPDITPEVFARILQGLPIHAQSIAMGLLLTGFRDQSEFFNEEAWVLKPATCQIQLLGRHTKSKKGRHVRIDEELWPYIVASMPAPIGYLQFLRHWHRACVAAGVAEYVPTGKTKLVREKLAVGQNYTRKGHRDVGQPEHEPRMIEVPQLRYKGLRPHDLRHALAQWSHEAGRSLEQLRKVLGHASVKTTSIYTESLDRGEVASTMGEIVKKRVLNK